MRTYSFGVETVPAALAGDLLIGSVHNGRNYRIMLARARGEEILETRFLGERNDWEGHAIARIEDGYVIGGAVEGKATPDGGEGWKAYIARLDESLNPLWEREIEIRGNECVYSILPAGGSIFIAGETGRPRNKGFFVGKLSMEGELDWLKDFGNWEDVVTASLLPGERPRLVGNVKDEGWKVITFDFAPNGNFLGQELLAEDGIALTAALWNGKLILAGYDGDDLWVWGGGWEVTIPNGSATSLLPLESRLLVGGEIEGRAIVMEFGSNGEILWKKPLWERGWVEVLAREIAAGVKEEGERTVMALEAIGR
ncbi:hypothetical protein A3L09_03920 [Thermococcus profundus]|uniref:Uncharacterized protein n=1 Tax=Thermococcus profundus TaxID=49899 RepID=A0A2Z2M7R2_THEPR|nr:hypothetical protein [Thermococcus profundus]ASJ02460.1 hypothetical protein A3L09_03920 [Thermococcus profundus]